MISAIIFPTLLPEERTPQPRGELGLALSIRGHFNECPFCSMLLEILTDFFPLRSNFFLGGGIRHGYRIIYQINNFYF